MTGRSGPGASDCCFPYSLDRARYPFAAGAASLSDPPSFALLPSAVARLSADVAIVTAIQRSPGVAKMRHEGPYSLLGPEAEMWHPNVQPSCQTSSPCALSGRPQLWRVLGTVRRIAHRELCVARAIAIGPASTRSISIISII